MTFTVRKWMWMMQWCRDKGLHPGEASVWSKAEEAFDKEHEK